jgi:tyrosine-protein phosphatase YwqE
MKILSWFNRNKSVSTKPLLNVDIHSHLIPGIDDGAQSIDESLRLIRGLCDLGYKKIITTPHVMLGTYNNTPEIIYNGLQKIREAIKSSGIQVEVEAAAEYYFDDHFIKQISDQKLLLFSDKYVLFELPVMFKPPQLEDVIFEITTRNLIPVLAHPERYLYMHTKGLDVYEKLKNRGVLLQLNLLSPIGYYSKPIQNVSKQLIKYGWIDLLGSDMHNEKHLHFSKRALEDKHIIELLNQPQLLNNKLI